MKTLLIAIFGAASSLAAMGANAAGCNGPECPAKVTIPSGCDSIKVDPDPISVGKGKVVVIKWQVDPQATDWQFTGQGIAFKDLTASWNVFGQPTKDSTGKVFTYLDNNTKAGTYPYTVELKNTKTNQVCRKDPTVVNE